MVPCDIESKHLQSIITSGMQRLMHVECDHCMLQLPVMTLFFCPGEQVGISALPTLVLAQIPRPSIRMTNSVRILEGSPSLASASIKSSSAWSTSKLFPLSCCRIASRITAFRFFCQPAFEATSKLTGALCRSTVKTMHRNPKCREFAPLQHPEEDSA